MVPHAGTVSASRARVATLAINRDRRTRSSRQGGKRLDACHLIDVKGFPELLLEQAEPSAKG
jgi:hypothetical protein